MAVVQCTVEKKPDFRQEVPRILIFGVRAPMKFYFIKHNMLTIFRSYCVEKNLSYSTAHTA